MSGVHVRVRVGGETFAFPIEHVLEVAELGDITPVPGAGVAVLGVRNLHGQILPVFDLAHVLGTPQTGRRGLLLVAERGTTRTGLAVDEVTDVSPIAAELEPADSDLLSDTGYESGCLVGVIDVEYVFAALGRQVT